MSATQHSFAYIEDHAASRRIMQLLLVEVMGFDRLTIFEDTQDIIQKLEAMPFVPDIIFLDVNLKPHDGYAVCAMVRANERLRQARVIALTASVSPHDLRKMQAAGFDGAIGKPLSQDTFSEQLQRILTGEPVWETQ